jgi:crossover junction endodeoxyribonuclease RuvC
MPALSPSDRGERIILGVDPGTRITGFGVIAEEKGDIRLLQFGILQLGGYTGHELRLKKIFDRILRLIDEFHPDEMAIEAQFYGKNVQSMLKLGRAQGVAMAAALSREIPICEYAPKKIKLAVTGRGNASKEQVAGMLQNIFRFPDPPALLDATDALAVALCHVYNLGPRQEKTKSWAAFLRDNPHRIK